MRPPVVIEIEVAAQAVPRFFWIGIIVQVNLFVFERAPEAFGADVIQRAPFAIHTEAHAGLLEPLRVLRRREMRALIAVPDFRCRLAQRALDRHHHKGHFQAFIQLPTQDVTAVPINHGHQIEPAAAALRLKVDDSQSFEPIARFDPTQNKFVAVPIDLGPATEQVFLISLARASASTAALPP